MSVVKVFIYDLSKGMARAMSLPLIGKQIDGIWHTGIVAYRQEYFFGGGGIESCQPCGTILGQPDSIVDLGSTEIPHEIFMEYLSELAQTSFRPDKYHLFHHNCNNFSSEIAKFLTGTDIPSYITNLPQDVLNTPFGAMLRPMVDSMSVAPEGGHQLFPSAGKHDVVEHNATTKNSSSGESKSLLTEINGVKIIQQPRIHEEFLANETHFKTTLNPAEFTLLTNLVDYVCGNGSSPVTNENIKAVGKIITSKPQTLANAEQDGDKVVLLKILHQGILEEMIQAFVITDPEKTIMKLIGTFAMSSERVKIGLAKLLLNCSANAMCCSFMLDASEWVLPPSIKTSCRKVTMMVLNSCLKGNSTEQILGAGTAHNFVKNDILDIAPDFISSLTKSLLEAVPKLSDQSALKLCLSTLNNIPQEMITQTNLEPSSRRIVLRATTDRDIDKLCEELNLKLTK